MSERKWYDVTFNGITFKCRVLDMYTEAEINERRKTCGLYDCYERPSARKIFIWENWKRWFRDMGSYDVWIRSYNCQTFTIGGTFEVHGNKFYAVITPTTQKLYKYE